MALNSLFQKCSGIISDYLWSGHPGPGSSASEKTLSNDQRFAKYELKLVSVASQLVDQVEESSASGNDNEPMYHLLDNMISEDILQDMPIPKGPFNKLRALARLHESMESNVGDFLSSTPEEAEHVTTMATNHNVAREHISISNYGIPPSEHRGESYDGLRLANKLRGVSQSLFNVLLRSSSCCMDACSYHVAKLQLVPPQSHKIYDETLPLHAYISSASTHEASPWIEILFDIAR